MADNARLLTIETDEELARFLKAAPADEPIALAIDAPAPDSLGSGAIGLATASTSASWPGLCSTQYNRRLAAGTLASHDYKSLLTAGLLPEVALGIDDLFLQASLVLADPSACEFSALCTRYLSQAAPAGATGRAAAIHDIASQAAP